MDQSESKQDEARVAGAAHRLRRCLSALPRLLDEYNSTGPRKPIGSAWSMARTTLETLATHLSKVRHSLAGEHSDAVAPFDEPRVPLVLSERERLLYLYLTKIRLYLQSTVEILAEVDGDPVLIADVHGAIGCIGTTLHPLGDDFERQAFFHFSRDDGHFITKRFDVASMLFVELQLLARVDEAQCFLRKHGDQKCAGTPAVEQAMAEVQGVVPSGRAHGARLHEETASLIRHWLSDLMLFLTTMRMLLNETVATPGELEAADGALVRDLRIVVVRLLSEVEESGLLSAHPELDSF